MRNGLFATLVLVLAGALSSPAAAQQWQLSAGGGPSFPTGKLADETERGFHLQGSVGYQLPALPAGVRLDLFYQDFDARTRAPSINVSYGGEWYRQLSGILNVTLASPASLGFVQPYVLLGGGVIREWHDDRTYSGKSQNTMNFNAGAGFEFPLFGSEGFLEARMMNLFGGEALPTGPPAIHREVQFKSIPVTLGVRL